MTLLFVCMQMNLLMTIKAVKEKPVWARDIFECRHVGLYNDNQEVVYFVFLWPP